MKIIKKKDVDTSENPALRNVVCKNNIYGEFYFQQHRIYTDLMLIGSNSIFNPLVSLMWRSSTASLCPSCHENPRFPVPGVTKNPE